MIDRRLNPDTINALKIVGAEWDIEDLDLVIMELINYYRNDLIRLESKSINIQKINLADEAMKIATDINKLRGIV